MREDPRFSLDVDPDVQLSFFSGWWTGLLAGLCLAYLIWG